MRNYSWFDGKDAGARVGRASGDNDCSACLMQDRIAGKAWATKTGKEFFCQAAD